MYTWCVHMCVYIYKCGDAREGREACVYICTCLWKAKVGAVSLLWSLSTCTSLTSHAHELKTQTKSGMWVAGLFGLYFQITVHLWGKSGQDVTQKSRGRDCGGLLLAGLLISLLADPCFITFIQPRTTCPKNGAAHSEKSPASVNKQDNQTHMPTGQ